VLFVQLVWKYAGVGVGNLFFFSGGKKRERKSSFAVFGFGVGEADCKCAFSCAVGLHCLFCRQDTRFINSDAYFIIPDRCSNNTDVSFILQDVSFKK